MSEAKGKTSLGIEQNLEGLLCYVLGWITGIIFLLLEKENKFVRFHAIQSIVVFGAYTVIAIILGFIPIIGWILGYLIGALAFILWVVLMVKAYQGQKYKLPWAGDFAEKQLQPETANKPETATKPETDNKPEAGTKP
ncbi:MAG: DUF4870 domain-containing protein [Dehalococcoidales bacterium]|nr:DUF4870 domain-containing protein [Dehalococcoidales bacterium]